MVLLGKQSLVLRAREITRGLEPSFFVPGVLKSFKDERVLAEVWSLIYDAPSQGASESCLLT